jgi:hypothetical protein
MIQSNWKPIIVRATPMDDSVEIITRYGESPSWGKPAVPGTSERRVYAKTVWDSLLSMTNTAGLWGSPPVTIRDPRLDGFEWILEGKKDSVYRVVYRTTPGLEEPTTLTCLYLLHIGGVGELRGEGYRFDPSERLKRGLERARATR